MGTQENPKVRLHANCSSCFLHYRKKMLCAFRLEMTILGTGPHKKRAVGRESGHVRKVGEGSQLRMNGIEGRLAFQECCTRGK